MRKSIKKLYGTWLSVKTTDGDEAELPDEHPLKYIFIKYQFSQPDHLNTATVKSKPCLKCLQTLAVEASTNKLSLRSAYINVTFRMKLKSPN